MGTIPSPPTAPANDAHVIARGFAIAERARRTIEHVHDVPTAELRLLWILAEGGPRTLKEISDGSGLEQSTVNRQVAAAEARGRVRRVSEPGSAAQLIERTDAGRDAFERASSLHLGAIAAGLAALGDDADAFVGMFDTFSTAFAGAAEGLEARA